MRPWHIVATTVLACAVLTIGLVPRLGVSVARADEVTASQDNLRTGWDPAEPGLSPATVSGGTFGQIFKTQLNGQVVGQPVVAGQTLIAVTENNYAYGLNAVTGAIEWQRSFGPPEPASATSCNNIVPNVGITGSPVYDPGSGDVYFVAVVNDGPSESQPHVYAYALDAATGSTVPGWPVTIAGSPVNAPADTFNPFTERQRTSLLLVNGSVYAAFASYCDYQPYLGYVAGINTSTRALTLWSDEAGLTDREGGIWQSNGGLVADPAGRIYLTSGNGVSPAVGPGSSPPPELGDAVVRLNVASDGTLSAGDFFSPANAPTLDALDHDFGSGGPVGLPFGTPSLPDLLVQAGKDGLVFLLNRDNLGGREQGPGGSDAPVSEAGPYAGQWGHPGAFGPQPSVTTGTSNDYVYYSGVGDVLRYLQFGVNGSNVPVLSDVANSSTTFGYSSGSPVVTSNGNDPASAVVWEVQTKGGTGAGAMLEAFKAVPDTSCTASKPCTMQPIWSAPIGTATEFATAATDSNRVYVGTRDGDILGFGSPDAAPLSGPQVNVGSAPVGQTANATVAMTASATVTVSGLSVTPAGSPFQLGQASVNGTPVSFPVQMSAGDKLTVPVTFAPSQAGGVAAAVQAATDATNFPTVSVGVSGQGTAPGLQASPQAVNFGSIPAGTTSDTTVQLSNDSGGSETVSATKAPGSPFTATLPKSGQTLTPGQVLSVPVTFHPGAAGAASSSFAVTAGGSTATVQLSGTGVTAVSDLASASSVSLGSVPVGSRGTGTIVITNKGNLPASVSGASGPLAPFATQASLTAGQPLAPGAQITVPVTFTPASTGPVTGQFAMTFSDAAGTHTLRVQLSGTGTAPASGHAVPQPGGGWTPNGGAHVHGAAMALVSSRHGTGSVVYPVPQPSGNVNIAFTAALGGNSGMTLALLSAGSAGPQSLGRGGGQLGFGGLSGVALEAKTGNIAGQPAGNLVGIATSTGAGLHLVKYTRAVPDLANGTHRIGLHVVNRTMTVFVNGHQELSLTLPAGAIPASALVAFTGATTSSTGTAQVSSGSMVTGSGSFPTPGGGWSFNGAAGMGGPTAKLTSAVANASGDVVYPVAQPTAGLNVTFTTQMFGGSGGNGLTLALLDPTKTTATTLGQPGGNNGFGGLTGVAVGLGTFHNYNVPNWAALWAGTAGSSKLVTLRTARAIVPLRVGPHTVNVQVTGTPGNFVVSVSIDGVVDIRESAPQLTATSVLAFTASTSTLTDIHLVRDVAITAG